MDLKVKERDELQVPGGGKTHRCQIVWMIIIEYVVKVGEWQSLIGLWFILHALPLKSEAGFSLENYNI